MCVAGGKERAGKVNEGFERPRDGAVGMRVVREE